MFQIGLQNILWLKKSKILRYGYMLLVSLTQKELLDRFTKKNWKTNHKKLRVIKRKDDKLYVKWKGFGYSLNSRTDKKGIA